MCRDAASKLSWIMAVSALNGCGIMTAVSSFEGGCIPCWVSCWPSAHSTAVVFHVEFHAEKKKRGRYIRRQCPSVYKITTTISSIVPSHGQPEKEASWKWASVLLIVTSNVLFMGSMPAVLTWDLEVARDRSRLKQSAHQLMSGRAMRFALKGDYWGFLPRTSGTHLFGAPRRIAADKDGRQADCTTMISSIRDQSKVNGGALNLRRLQKALLNDIITVLRRYDSFDKL